MQTQTVRLGDVIIDKKLLELRHLNSFMVSRYRQNYRMGAKFPPPIIQAGTNRVVSGNHRVTAMLGEFSPDHHIEVVIKEYNSEREVLTEFTRENATHGWPLDGISKRRLIQALINEGAEPEEIAKLLDTPVKNIVKSGEGCAVVIQPQGEREVHPVKQGLPQGLTMTSQQYEGHMEKDLGLYVSQLANQLIRHIRDGWVTRTETNTAALQKLYEVLAIFLADG